VEKSLMALVQLVVLCV